MRRSLILIVAAAAGCARSTQIDPAEISTRRTTVLAVPEVRSIYSEASAPIEALVRVPMEDAVHAIKKSLIELEIPITIEDPKVNAIGNNNFNKVYRMAGRPMMEYVDCGVSGSGARAATHRIYMSFITTVETVSNNSTRVRSQLSATARDISAGNTGPGVPCGSTGKLERIVLDSVRVMGER